MPSLRALECFLAVVETGSVTEAARRVHLSQPALSHQLRVLEDELGAPLLERRTRGAFPTTAGRALASEARVAVEAVDRGVDAAKAAARGAAGHLRVGSFPSFTGPLLAPALHAWHQRYPEVRISLMELADPNDYDRALREGRLDIALTSMPDKAGVDVLSLGHEEIVVAMSNDHPLAGRRTPPTIAELADGDFVHYRPTSGLRRLVEGHAARHGAILRPVLESRDLKAASLLAAAGFGTALIPTTALDDAFPGTLRHLRPRLAREVVVLSNSDTDSLVASLRQEFSNRGIPALDRVR